MLTIKQVNAKYHSLHTMHVNFTLSEAVKLCAW